MASFDPVIKWTGSKRPIAQSVTDRFPDEYTAYYEPFIGGGSILYAESPTDATCADVCEPLIELWRLIRDDPEGVIEHYADRWKRLQNEGEDVYYEVRQEFNDCGDPRDLFFLTRTCVNGLIRFNSAGEFNTSYHLTRPGIHPRRLGPIVTDWSRHIQNVEFLVGDYDETTDSATEGDFAYLDPPYFGTSGMYYGSIDRDRFLEFLDDLNDRGVRYALSLDGTSGDDDYTVDLPDWAYENQFAVESNSSSFKRVLDGEVDQVTESLYLNYDPSHGDHQTSLDGFVLD